MNEIGNANYPVECIRPASIGQLEAEIWRLREAWKYDERLNAALEAVERAIASIRREQDDNSRANRKAAADPRGER